MDKAFRRGLENVKKYVGDASVLVYLHVFGKKTFLQCK
jgi:hypothetical protein